MDNKTLRETTHDDSTSLDIGTLTYYASTLITTESAAALIINLYILNCSRYLRRPIGVNLRLCVSLTAADAACALFYMTSNLINVIIPTLINRAQIVSHCISLLVECLKIATFFVSVFILLALAINHYVGIVHPLYRHAITTNAVRTTILLAYVVPMLFFIGLYSVMPGGFRNHRAFGFFSADGCEGADIMTKFPVRLITVIPFIIFVITIAFLYFHIVIHMRAVNKDPMLHEGSIRKKRSCNRRLLTTLVLLAGSAALGWLPTLFGHIVFCSECFIRLSGYPLMFLLIFCQVINVFKLIVDGFVYANRMVEIRYSIWIFHSSCKKLITGQNEKEERMPKEFVRYLNDTIEQKSRRVTGHSSGASSFVSRSFNSSRFNVPPLSPGSGAIYAGQVNRKLNV
uniref:G_PROTEIN_RECEP_F1_2 domain-containing protein n=1 Tax=Ascaris lumbricoides TaxID=6252 RepID=A0A0M3HUF7_ASCLU